MSPVWLTPILTQLTQDAASLRGHAFLLLGPLGLGQEWLIQHVLQQWLGRQMNDDPDVLVVEALEGKRDIGVDQIRALSSWAQQTAHGQQGRVVIVHQAERLNTAAANSLLKTLEEPPFGVRFLITAARAGKLLPTLLSRCQRLNLPVPPLAEAMTCLAAAVPTAHQDECRLALQLHAGAPFAAQAWLLGSGLSEWREWQGYWQQSQQQQRMTSALQQWARADAARFCRLLAAQSYLMGQRYDALLPWQLLRLVWQVEQSLAQNISKELLVDNLMMAVNEILSGKMLTMTLSQRRGLLS